MDSSFSVTCFKFSRCPMRCTQLTLNAPMLGVSHLPIFKKKHAIFKAAVYLYTDMIWYDMIWYTLNMCIDYSWLITHVRFRNLKLLFLIYIILSAMARRALPSVHVVRRQISHHWKDCAFVATQSSLRSMGSQNWWFGDPKEPCQKESQTPSFWRVPADS